MTEWWTHSLQNYKYVIILRYHIPMSISSTASSTVHSSFATVFTKGYKLHTTSLKKHEHTIKLSMVAKTSEAVDLTS